MVRWQNQEDPGYATPSSSEEEPEELDNKTPAKHLIKNMPIPKSDCQTDIWDFERDHGKSLAGWSNTNLNDESLWGWSDDGLGEPQDWMRPANPGGGGARVRKHWHYTSLSRNKSKPHYIARNNWSLLVKQQSQEDPRCFYQINTENRSSPQQQKDLSLIKPRHPMWSNADSAWGERSDDFLSTSPMHNPTATDHKLELFLSLLPWGKYLLTPGKLEKSLTYPRTGPGILNRHPGLPIPPSQDEGDDYSLYSNEPREFFSQIPIFDEDDFFEEPLGMNGLSKPRSYEFKNDPWCQRDFTDVPEEDNWKHRVLFPSENLDDHSHLSDSARN